jgi:hypothetical protein
VRSQAELYDGLRVRIRQLVAHNPRLMLSELSCTVG